MTDAIAGLILLILMAAAVGCLIMLGFAIAEANQTGAACAEIAGTRFNFMDNICWGPDGRRVFFD